MAEGNFADGRGPKSKDTPAEFPSDWHYHAELEAIERDLAGWLARVEELKAMQDVPASTMAEAESGVEAARARLKHYGVGQKKAAKRPSRAAKAETRKAK